LANGSFRAIRNTVVGQFETVIFLWVNAWEHFISMKKNGDYAEGNTRLPLEFVAG
jgi:hypothetical protein